MQVPTNTPIADLSSVRLLLQIFEGATVLHGMLLLLKAKAVPLHA
jgi:hypothetical protein